MASRNLKENFKFSIKVCTVILYFKDLNFDVQVVDNHAFFQTKSDKTSSVLKNPQNNPQVWMHKTSADEIQKFEEIIKGYEKEAKKVRLKLIGKWISEELDCFEDPVQRLNSLRTSREEEDIWPCYNCAALG